MGGLSHFDGKSLQTFIDTELHDFVTATQNIRQDDPAGAGRALKSLVENQTTPETLQQNQFLAIGPMTADDLTHGKSLVEGVTKSATSIDKILADQERLFRDIDRDFRQTLKVIGNTQSDSLTEIDGQKMLDIFEDVDGDLSGADGSRNLNT
ncbi:type VII secretion system-associated protein [Streptomyces sp. NPDC046203]|uniref:type VII secretion system-associated protein n=1 Tax=Streptomyces sp. NPDC046203 TaxID=3154602 RepID=UPI0033CD85CB